MGTVGGQGFCIAISGTACCLSLALVKYLNDLDKHPSEYTPKLHYQTEYKKAAELAWQVKQGVPLGP